MRRWLFVFAMLFLAPSAWAQDIRDCSAQASDDGRTLCVEAELAAPIAEVWALWSESGQLATWMAPVAAIDLRPGGIMEASYDPNGRIGDPGNILNRVVAVSPMQSLTIQVERAPPGFPYPQDVRELVTVIELQPLSAGTTRVRVSMSGYRDGAAFDELRTFFARGNAWTLQKLRERVVDGPVNWAEPRQ